MLISATFNSTEGMQKLSRWYQKHEIILKLKTKKTKEIPILGKGERCRKLERTVGNAKKQLEP